ncbi:MAG: AbrB/MazE/SpoVT family DNA-binding domain-containing protein [Candidatus Hadarchaeales archaeon]
MAIKNLETKISKGYQTVVPAKLRKAYGISPGDRTIWEEGKGEIKNQDQKEKELQEIIGMVSGREGMDAVELKKKAQRGEL